MAGSTVEGDCATVCCYTPGSRSSALGLAKLRDPAYNARPQCVVFVGFNRVQTMAANARLLLQPIRDVTVVTFQDSSILDTLQVEAIGQELFALVDDKACRKLVLDFANVKFLSSSALGVLINLRKKADAIKGQIILCGLRADLKKVFEITRLDKLFKFREDENKALADFGIVMA